MASLPASANPQPRKRAATLAAWSIERAVVLEPAWTTGDPRLTESLFGNLVSNAIRYIHRGGQFDVSTFVAAGSAIFRIANAGRIVSAGALARLFQPFERLGSEGMGVGLAIVHAIADAHDATVTTHVRPTGGVAVDLAFIAHA